MALENLKQEIADKKLDKIQEDFEIINKSIEKIQALIKQLTNLENPQVIDYTDNSKMIKLD
jgi:uncharacterized protein YlaN (UPF0358 family)